MLGRQAADDDGWKWCSVSAEMWDSSDGVVERLVGIELFSGSFVEPSPEPVEHAVGYSVDSLFGVPLSGFIEVEAELKSGQYVGVSEKSGVVDVDDWWAFIRGVDGKNEGLLILKRKPAVDGLDPAGCEGEPDVQRSAFVIDRATVKDLEGGRQFAG